MEDVKEFDECFDLQSTTEPTIHNLAFLSNALAGEVGEMCNVVKKIWRDGETEELVQELDEELVDILIYFIKLLRTAGIDEEQFRRKWTEKHRLLYSRWLDDDSSSYKSGYRTNIDRKLKLTRSEQE